MPPSRLPFFFVAKCAACHKIFSSYQLVRRWEAAEAKKVNTSACPCGGNRFSPYNPTLWEELTTPCIWEVIWKDVIKPKLGLA